MKKSGVSESNSELAKPRLKSLEKLEAESLLADKAELELELEVILALSC